MSVTKYDDIRLNVAENGFILEYVEIRKKPGKTDASRYENTIRDWKKEVFEFANGAAALKRMTELAVNSNPNAAKALKEAID